jgi:signal transduction histidine kinase
MVIKDNGRGVESMPKGNGNGLENMKRRAEESGGVFSLINNTDSGLTINVKNIPFAKNPTKVV